MNRAVSVVFNQEQWRGVYCYGLYNHRLMSANGEVYTRPFIVIKNRIGVIVRFTNLHNYAGVFDGKVFVPIKSDAEAKLHYICMMLNYVLIERFTKFRIDHVFKINSNALEQFFRDYAAAQLPNGEFRGKQSVEKCVYTVTAFFRNLCRKFSGYLVLTESDLVTEKTVYNNYGKPKKKRVPSFQVKGIVKPVKAFRELPMKAFQALLNLAFRYAPDIAFAICLQSFAGLRAGEVCNVRQEGSPAGNGLLFTRVEGRVTKVEIDLTRELPMRSDGIICGRIKKERIQCVYPPFIAAFTAAYELHKKYLAGRTYEDAYRPMFINSQGMALTYADYRRRFSILVDEHFRTALLRNEDPECRIYGQMLYENRLGLHALRHLFSTQLVLHGEGIAQIQYWRGDKSPESAFAYLQDKGDLQKELENANELLADVLMAQGSKYFGGDDGQPVR